MTSDVLDLRARTAIVGVADAASATGVLDTWGHALQAQVAHEALADAGLSIGDVDGLALAGAPLEAMQVAEYLGIAPRWSDTSHQGGSSFESHVEHAAAALATGACDVALIVYANTPRGNFKRFGRGRDNGASHAYGPAFVEWELPYGAALPVTGYALAAQRHQSQFGTTPEQMAAVAVAARQWAATNPRARNQEPLSVEDVLASPLVSGPLHQRDCCLVTDGAAAIVMTRADRARDLRGDSAYVLGAASAHSHLQIAQMDDLTVTAAARSGPRAFAQAGIGPDDVDVAQLYDSFTITVLLALEDLGFCPKGEAGAFAAEQGLGPGQALPTNTGGGGLSYTHPGMFGLFLLVEAARQLRGQSAGTAVPGVDISLAHGSGGVLSHAATVVLGSEATR